MKHLFILIDRIIYSLIIVMVFLIGLIVMPIMMFVMFLWDFDLRIKEMKEDIKRCSKRYA